MIQRRSAHNFARLSLFALAPFLALALPACTGDSGNSGGPSSGGKPPAGTSGGAGGPATPGAALKIGYVLHGSNPFTEQIKQGAMDAGKDLNAEVEVTGPAGFNDQEARGMFEAMAQKKKDGIVCVPMPGNNWVKPIKEVMAAGIPVVTANITSEESGAPSWFGQDEYQSGVIMAEQLKKQLAAAGKKAGKIAVGNCAPGVEVLVDRYKGLKKGFEGTAFTVLDAVDVKTAQTENYNAWESLATAHPDAVAIVGLCSMDVPNLYKLKDRSKAKWLVGGYDLTKEALDSVKSGTTQVVLGQHPYLQGYLAVKALVVHIRDKKPLPQGWVDVGTEIITKENVDSVYARETDEAARTKWYADHIAKNFGDMAGSAKPLPSH
jgi:ribose transport system substrate-binding protein